MSPPVFETDVSVFYRSGLVISTLALAHQMARRPPAVWSQLLRVDGALNMVAPSTLVGVTGRTGISRLRYLFPYCSTWAFAASVSASIAC